jgi:hypothetical protein
MPRHWRSYPCRIFGMSSIIEGHQSSIILYFCTAIEFAEKEKLGYYEILRIAERGTISVQKMSPREQEEICRELQLFQSKKMQLLMVIGCKATFRGVREVSSIFLDVLEVNVD